MDAKQIISEETRLLICKDAISAVYYPLALFSIAGAIDYLPDMYPKIDYMANKAFLLTTNLYDESEIIYTSIWMVIKLHGVNPDDEVVSEIFEYYLSRNILSLSTNTINVLKKCNLLDYEGARKRMMKDREIG